MSEMKKATPAAICAWAKKTFPNATEEGRLNKFFDEAAEYGLVRKKDRRGFRRDVDPSELGDVLVTLVQVMEDEFGPWDQPGGAQDVMDNLLHKLENREWNIDPETGTGQHSKEAPSGITGIQNAADGDEGTP